MNIYLVYVIVWVIRSSWVDFVLSFLLFWAVQVHFSVSLKILRKFQMVTAAPKLIKTEKQWQIRITLSYIYLHMSAMCLSEA